MSMQSALDAAMFESPQRSNSPKRLRSSLGDENSDEALIDRIFGSALPAKVFQEVKQVVRKFATAIGKLSRAVTRRDKARRDIDELKEGRYPPGVRPYLPGSLVGLQSPLELASDRDYTLVVQLPQGITRQDAMAKVHLAAATFYKEVDKEMLDEYVDELKAQTDYDAFVAEACAPASRHHTAVQSLGITLPPGLEAPVRVSKEKALELYVGVINRLAEEKIQRENEEQKKRTEKQKLKQAVENANPRDLFDQAVRQVLRDAPQASTSANVDYVLANLGTPADQCLRDDPPQRLETGKGKGKGKTGDQHNKRRFTKQQLAQRKVRQGPEQQQQTKNGKSQGAGPGDNRQSKGKSTGKGQSLKGGKGKNGKGSSSGKGTKGQQKGKSHGQKWW